ncbi:MAG TPA: ATP-binding protein [Pyrinomonadaceae bacterium]|nr:ATP-binding protein [Pyrinomonadaceae bacterium]
MSSVEAHIELCNSLMAANRMWEVTIDTLPDAVYIFGPDKRLSRINRAGETLERATRSFLTRRSCCDMLWGVEGTSCMVDRAVANGAAVEVELSAGNKSQRSLLVRVIPAEKSQKTNAAGCIVIARDVTELRGVEEEAGKQRAFLASLADLAPDEIYSLDTERRFTWMNQRAEVDSGFTQSVLLGQEFNVILTADSRAEGSAAVAYTLGGEEKQFEVRTLCTDGRVRCMDVHTSPLWSDGNITGVMVFMSDITERKLAQERAARSDKLRALGELAAGVAHNLNNSLTVIQGRAQLLLMRNSAEEGNKKSLEVITQAVSDCSQTLRRLLDFSRRDATRNSATVDLSELITSSIEIARPKWQSDAASRSGTIEVRIEAANSVNVLGDSSELREVVLNLIFNAVDAMPNGGTIVAGTRIEGQTGRFWVADTGSGIAQAVMARIFEPFYSTKGERGTGLGLSASHGIIENHGGDIDVTSELGKGTRFEIILPLHEVASPSVVADAKPISGARTARVLVVEDEENIRTLLNDAFCAEGHDVVEASTGAEALERLDKGKFDLMICDLGLPELSGLHVARWVKEFRPDLPVIIATGYAEMIAEEDYGKARIDAVIRKPYAIADVLARANLVLAAQPISHDENLVV